MNKEEKKLKKVCDLMGIYIGDLPAFPKKDTDLILLAITIGLVKNYISKQEVKERIEEYFKGLIVIPEPQLTKDKLLELLK